MPTITRTITGDVDDLTAVTLTYLARTDTGASVTIPGGGAFAKSGSAWSILFTAPAPGLTYAYSYRRQFADGTHLDGSGVLVDGGGDGLGSTVGVQDQYGVFNADTYADLQGQGDPSYISARYGRALAAARGYAKSRFIAQGVPWPPTNGFKFSERLTAALDEYAGAWLYFGRSKADRQSQFPGTNGEGIDGAMSGHLQDAKDEIDWIVTHSLPSIMEAQAELGPLAGDAGVAMGVGTDCGWARDGRC